MIPALMIAAVLVCPAPLTPIEQRALAATVRLRVGDRTTATAVVVGRKKDDLYLLTADHATDGPDTTLLIFEFFTDGKPEKPSHTLKGAKAEFRQPIADWALLKVAVDPRQSVVAIPLAPPGKTPKRFPFQALSVGCSLGDPPSCEKETMLAKRLAVRRDENVAFFWQAEKSQARGRSGGPLLNTDGEVIGISAATSLGKGYYVHVSELHAVLKTEGFEWLWMPEKSKGPAEK